VVLSATGQVRAVMVDYSLNTSYDKLLLAYSGSSWLARGICHLRNNERRARE
jgi:hypothetical protein